MKSIPENIRFQLFFEMRHRTGPDGTPEDWTANDRFRAVQGPEGGLIYVYRSIVETDLAAQAFLTELGYEECVARGFFITAKRQMGFHEPKATSDCLVLIKRFVADDNDMIRYYGKYYVIASNGDDCGIVRDCAR
jgi:hypothetical protein